MTQKTTHEETVPESIILPEIQVDLLKHDDQKRAQIKKTLAALANITGLSWCVVQYSESEPYTYALDDERVPLAMKPDWEVYNAVGETINITLNKNTHLVARHKGRRDVFPYGKDAEGIRFATVGGTIYNNRKIAAALLLAPAIEDEEALSELKKIDFTNLATQVKAMLKKASAEIEFSKNIEERLGNKSL